jgi:hypothetical protein
MTAEEREIMTQHAACCTKLMHQGDVVVFGPLMDLAPVYGIGVAEAEDEVELRSLLDIDPAAPLNRYEVLPMRAVHPGQQKVSG